jgi:hypothetical protein
LRVIRCRSKNRHSVPIPTGVPRSVSSTCDSTSVMSSFASIAAGMKATCASILAARRSPPCSLAAAVPC